MVSFVGPRAIKEKLEDYYEINPLPSESTIGRILAHHGLTNSVLSIVPHLKNTPKHMI